MSARVHLEVIRGGITVRADVDVPAAAEAATITRDLVETFKVVLDTLYPPLYVDGPQSGGTTAEPAQPEPISEPMLICPRCRTSYPKLFDGLCKNCLAKAEDDLAYVQAAAEKMKAEADPLTEALAELEDTDPIVAEAADRLAAVANKITGKTTVVVPPVARCAFCNKPMPPDVTGYTCRSCTPAAKRPTSAPPAAPVQTIPIADREATCTHGRSTFDPCVDCDREKAGEPDRPATHCDHGVLIARTCDECARVTSGPKPGVRHLPPDVVNARRDGINRHHHAAGKHKTPRDNCPDCQEAAAS